MWVRLYSRLAVRLGFGFFDLSWFELSLFICWGFEGRLGVFRFRFGYSWWFLGRF